MNTPTHEPTPEERVARATLYATARDVLHPILEAWTALAQHPARELIPKLLPDQSIEHLAGLAHLLAATEPDQSIPRFDQRPYLARWHLLEDGRRPSEEDLQPGRGRNFLHHFQSDDDIVPHDHPWPSASLDLEGAMTEHWRDTGRGERERCTCIHPGHVVLRRPTLTHRLEQQRTPGALTLFATLPKQRAWGFWYGSGANARFVDWTQYYRERAAH